MQYSGQYDLSFNYSFPVFQTKENLPDNENPSWFPDREVGRLSSTSVTTCTTHCTMNPLCSLVCLEGDECIQYDIVVGRNYDPSSYSGFVRTRVCYSR